MPSNAGPTTAADRLATASTNRFLDQAAESDGPLTGQRGPERQAGR